MLILLNFEYFWIFTHITFQGKIKFSLMPSFSYIFSMSSASEVSDILNFQLFRLLKIKNSASDFCFPNFLPALGSRNFIYLALLRRLPMSSSVFTKCDSVNWVASSSLDRLDLNFGRCEILTIWTKRGLGTPRRWFDPETKRDPFMELTDLRNRVKP